MEIASGTRNALGRLSVGRFRSFSDAVETVVGALAEALPGLVLLARVEPDGQTCRIVDIAGIGIGRLQRGDILPISMSDQVVNLEPEYLRSLGAQARLAKPLENSAGIITGVLCALSPEDEDFHSEHVALLGVGAVLLGHEQESVQQRAELRRLHARLSEGPGIDPETGLADQSAFLEPLEREWNLAKRGTVESVLLTFTVEAPGKESGSEDVELRLAVKVAAEVLSACARETDHVSRVGPRTLATVLVGCGAEEAPAFVERFQGALRRVTSGRSAFQISCRVQPLAALGALEGALEEADRAPSGPADQQKVHRAPEVVG